ncbi:sugar diacid utilization regulator [Tenggerimyces flavus]|nr:sugar diacid utilization regulator [Tenggerimyces flavus]
MAVLVGHHARDRSGAAAGAAGVRAAAAGVRARTHRTVLLGYLWVIDEDEKLSDSDLSLIDGEAGLVGQLLYQEQLLEKVQRGKENELARDLLSESAALSEAAAAELADLGSFVSSGSCVVTVVQPSPGVEVPPDLRVVLADALHGASRQFSPRHSLYLTRGREGLLLTTHAVAEGVYAQLSAVVAGLVRSVSGQLGAAVDVRAGIGEAVSSSTALHVSYRQACLALRVARAVPTFGAVTAFPDLGVYRILATLPAESLTPDLLDAGLRRLLREGPPIMTETLETYLDCACDSTRTAAALHIHRTTLHYRLGRIQEITGADLNDGTQRLTLHLGLKAARLAPDPPA